MLPGSQHLLPCFSVLPPPVCRAADPSYSAGAVLQPAWLPSNFALLTPESHCSVSTLKTCTASRGLATSTTCTTLRI